MTQRLRVRRATGPRRGFTIVELIVTMLVLTVGMLGLAATAGVITKQMGNGSRNTMGAVQAQALMDSLASINCTTLGTTHTDSASLRGVKQKWTVTDGNDIKNVVDSVFIKGRRLPFVYRSIISCRD